MSRSQSLRRRSALPGEAGLRALFEAGASFADLGRLAGLSPARVRRRARRDGWGPFEPEAAPRGGVGQVGDAIHDAGMRSGDGAIEMKSADRKPSPLARRRTRTVEAATQEPNAGATVPVTPKRQRRPRPPKAALNSSDRAALVGRLTEAFERQVAEIETRFADPDPAAGEREARTLAVLAKTLETLIDLERTARGDQPADPETDLDALRQDLARRLDRLRATR